MFLSVADEKVVLNARALLQRNIVILEAWEVREALQNRLPAAAKVLRLSQSCEGGLGYITLGRLFLTCFWHAGMGTK